MSDHVRARRHAEHSVGLAAELRRTPVPDPIRYVREGDEQLRQSSNRTYARIVAALPPALAARLGYAEDKPTDDEAAIKAAVAAGDWKRVAELSSTLLARKSAG